MPDWLKKVPEALKKGKLAAILGIAGIVLIGLSSFITLPKSTNSKKTVTDPEEYRAVLESGIAGLVTRISGDKNPTVLVTLESGVRYDYADETEQKVNGKTGGTESTNESNSTRRTITVKTEDGGEQALVIAEYMPKICGVAVICDTANSEKVRDAVCEALSAALGITSKRVYVGTTEQSVRK